MATRRTLRQGLVAGLLAGLAVVSGYLTAQPRPPRLRSRAEPTWVRLGGPPGGLGYDIRYSFADHDRWYVTDAWAGLHVSDDHGVTWRASSAGITTRVHSGAADAIPVFCVTVDPHEPNIVWVGTQNSGELFRSTDGGVTWAKRSEGIDPQLAPFLSFRGITVDPRGSEILVAMGEISSPGWTNDGSSRTGLALDMTQGIVYRSTDSGEHWTEIWRGNNLARYCWIDPRDPDVLYVSTGIFDREAANTDVNAGFAGGVGILKSSDGGLTWRELNQANGLGDLFVSSLFMHPTDPDTLVAAAAQDGWSGHGSTFTGGVFVTHDAGEHWNRVLQDEIFSAVEICTCDPGVWYAASTRAVHRSEDGGETWLELSRPDGRWGPPGVIAGFPIDLQCDPDDAHTLFANNYLGGNFLSNDGGETWSLASEGYTGALVRQVVVDQTGGDTVFAGGRVGIFRSDDRGANWVGLAYPPAEASGAVLNEIEALAVDAADPNHLVAAPADVFNLVLSSDAGRSWQLARGLNGLPRTVAFAPSDGDVAYASVLPPACWPPLGDGESCDETGADLFVSRDGGATWISAAGGAIDTAILTLAVDPHDPAVVWAGTLRIGVIRTTNGGVTWQPTGDALVDASVRAIALDSNEPETAYAASDRGLYRTTTGGHEWIQVSAGLPPEASIRSVVVDPTDSAVAYASDWFSGVYGTSDAGNTWHAVNRGLVHRTVNSLGISPEGRWLYAAIEGDGVYRLDTRPGALW